MRLGRRHLIIGTCLLLAGCGGGAPAPSFQPLDYSFLPKLQLNVARIDIADSWVPGPGGKHVENLAPETPLAALRQLIRDRLTAGGSSGRAVATIDDASIVQNDQNYAGNLAVHLDLLNDDGSRQGGIDARVQALRPISDADDPNAVSSDLYALTKALMDDMNVELEYQIRNKLGSALQATSPDAPAPAAVNTQDLSAPGATIPAGPK